MRWTRTIWWGSLWSTLLWVLATAPPSSFAQEAIVAEILSPQNGANVKGFKVTVTGRVASGLWPFIAVAPEEARPSIWIQSRIKKVKKDGTFKGKIFLGTKKLGAREFFDIFIFAHPDRRRFQTGELLRGLPQDVSVSEPVIVFRTK